MKYYVHVGIGPCTLLNWFIKARLQHAALVLPCYQIYYSRINQRNRWWNAHHVGDIAKYTANNVLVNNRERYQRLVLVLWWINMPGTNQIREHRFNTGRHPIVIGIKERMPDFPGSLNCHQMADSRIYRMVSDESIKYLPFSWIHLIVPLSILLCYRCEVSFYLASLQYQIKKHQNTNDT